MFSWSSSLFQNHVFKKKKRRVICSRVPFLQFKQMVQSCRPLSSDAMFIVAAHLKNVLPSIMLLLQLL